MTISRRINRKQHTKTKSKPKPKPRPPIKNPFTKFRNRVISCCDNLLGEYVTPGDTPDCRSQMQQVLTTLARFPSDHSYENICCHFLDARKCENGPEITKRAIDRMDVIYRSYSTFQRKKGSTMFRHAIDTMFNQVWNREFRDILYRATGAFVTGDDTRKPFGTLLLQYLESLTLPTNNACSYDINFNLIISLVMEQSLVIYLKPQ